MQKQYRLAIPSFITVETEDGSWIGEKDAQKTEKDDVVVTYETTPEAEEVWLTADQTKVKTIKFRWNTPVNKKSRILGGSWERTYGDELMRAGIPVDRQELNKKGGDFASLLYTIKKVD